MLQGTIITIGPLPAHMRAVESRIVRALPTPERGMIRHVCACTLAATACFVAAFAWSLVGAP
jgi:hypothetical protein